MMYFSEISKKMIYQMYKSVYRISVSLLQPHYQLIRYLQCCRKLVKNASRFVEGTLIHHQKFLLLYSTVLYLYYPVLFNYISVLEEENRIFVQFIIVPSKVLI
ncbi:heavy metal-associated domain containing protein [Brugia malayi]|uniref:Heavy metal-associated domain containing protein n=1 Tax=Brugia malayi TaxID=6279 RepID=A0A4E9F9P2_BRUMA|nr:heavy metal-associated domain containing protein [Brugia malayi]VIO92753.1 heavy metal-associated domain containing protein [Brugia malayi]